MTKLRGLPAFLRNHPFIFAIFALVVSRIAGMGAIQAVQLVNPDWSIQNQLGWLLMLVYATVVVSLVYWTDTADAIGLKKPESPKEWLTLIPLLSLPLIILLENGVSSWGFSQNIVLLIAALGVSINEEVLFRGVLLRGFMRWGTWVAILVPSALFALAHSTNVIAGGNATFAVFQTIWTFTAGVALSALRLRNKSLYPVIVLHILIDGVEYFSTGEYGVHSQDFSMTWLIMNASLNAALAAYTLFLLMKSPKRQQPAAAA